MKKFVTEHFGLASLLSFIFFIVIPIFLYTDIKRVSSENQALTTSRPTVTLCNSKTNPTYEWTKDDSNDYTHTTYYAPIQTTDPRVKPQPLAYRATVYPDYYVNGMPVIDDTYSYRTSNYNYGINYYQPNYQPNFYPENYQTTYYDPRYVNYSRDPNYYTPNYYNPTYYNSSPYNDTQKANPMWKTCSGPNTCNEW